MEPTVRELDLTNVEDQPWLDHVEHLRQPRPSEPCATSKQQPGYLQERSGPHYELGHARVDQPAGYTAGDRGTPGYVQAGYSNGAMS